MGRKGYFQGAIREGSDAFPYDMARGFVSGNVYAGKTYGDRRYQTDRPTGHKAYLIGALDRYRKNKVPKWGRKSGDEYLPQFLTAYMDPQDHKLPLLYAMDIRHKLNLINEEARRLGVTYAGNNKALQESLTQAARKMITAGVANKLPMGALLNTVGSNPRNLADAYLNKQAENVYRTQQRMKGK